MTHTTHGTHFHSGFNTRTPHTLVQFEPARCTMRIEGSLANLSVRGMRLAGLERFHVTVHLSSWTVSSVSRATATSSAPRFRRHTQCRQRPRPSTP